MKNGAIFVAVVAACCTLMAPSANAATVYLSCSVETFRKDANGKIVEWLNPDGSKGATYEITFDEAAKTMTTGGHYKTQAVFTDEFIEQIPKVEGGPWTRIERISGVVRSYPRGDYSYNWLYGTCKRVTRKF